MCVCVRMVGAVENHLSAALVGKNHSTAAFCATAVVDERLGFYIV